MRTSHSSGAALGQEVSSLIARADRVLLHEVMQHVDKPLELLLGVHDLLAPDGLTFVMFTPWSSPYGAGTKNLPPVPWLHLVYPKSVVAEIRSSNSGWHSRDLAATGLYKLTVVKFLELVERADLDVVELQLLPVWRQHRMLRWPVLWELACAKVGAVLNVRV